MSKHKSTRKAAQETTRSGGSELKVKPSKSRKRRRNRKSVLEELTAEALSALTPAEMMRLSERLGEEQRRPETTHCPVRPEGLIVVRESDEWDDQVFDAMREMTYQDLRHVPAIDAIRRAGLKPMRCGGSFMVDWVDDGVPSRREILVSVVRRGRTKAFVFFFEGYWHLWSQASAAKVSDSGFNEFTTILIDEVTRLRPKTLYAANLSRLIRSQFEEKRLSMGLSGNVDQIVAKDMTITLSGSNSALGFMQLTMMGFCAATERNAIVQRLLAGKIAKWRRDEWPFGKGVVPFGYEYDPKARQLRAVPELKATVREMLIVLASSAPPSQKARELDRLGVSTMRRNPKTGQPTPFGSKRSPDEAVRAMYSWVPVWVTGEFLFRYQNPIDDLMELSGIPVVRYPAADGRDDPHDPGELQMLHKVPLPLGGWADSTILAELTRRAAMESDEVARSTYGNPARPVAPESVVKSDNPTLLRLILPDKNLRGIDSRNMARRDAARSRRTVSAFTGRTWIDEHWLYELQYAADNTYLVTRFPRSVLDEESDVEYARHLAERERDGS